jgi:hypothetical protein
MMREASATSVKLALAFLPRLSNEICRGSAQIHHGAAADAFDKLLNRRPVGEVAPLCEQVLRDRHPPPRGPRLQPAMRVLGHVSDYAPRVGPRLAKTTGNATASAMNA